MLEKSYDVSVALVEKGYLDKYFLKETYILGLPKHKIQHMFSTANAVYFEKKNKKQQNISLYLLYVWTYMPKKTV